jgi:ABC-type bacteriocin/lantibiotic exporter with double-glycine peptidase domain
MSLAALKRPRLLEKLWMDPINTRSEDRPSGSPPRTEAGQLARTLEQLARQTGVPFDPQLARDASARAVRSNPGGESSHRFEQLIAAASECSLRVVPIRSTLAEVVWMARRDSPIVALTRSGDWIVLARRGAFHLRAANADGRPGYRRIRRESLARELGLDSAEQSADFAVVHPERPAADLDGHGGATAGGVHSDHGDAHSHAEEHPTPHRRLMGLLRAEMPDVWSIVLFSVITGILYLAVPLTVDAVVNNIAFGGQQQVYVQALVVLSAALLAFLGLLAFVRAVQHYLAEVIQRRIFVRLAADLAYRLPRVTASATDRIHAPELVNRFFDVLTVQKSTALLLLDGVNLVLSAVIGMVVLGFYHPSLLAFDLVLLALVCLVVFGLGRGAVKTSIQESVSKYAIAGWLQEVAHFPNLFKSPGGSQFALDRADLLARRYLDARRSHFRILMRQIGGLLAIQAIASSSLLVVGGVLVLSGELTLGQLVASEIIVNAVVASVAKLGKHLEGWYDAMAAVDKIGYLVDLETEREAGDVPSDRSQPARVDVAGVSFTYDQKPALTSLSFTLEPRISTAIQAPLGGGASTLLDLLYGLRTPSEGHVLIDRLDVRQWSLEGLRQDVALVRHHDIIEASVADNIRLARADIGLDEVREVLATVGLLDDILQLPQGLESPLLFGGRPLTSMQRTRLIIARAIVGRPRLLLLDEVLDGLEPTALESLAEILFHPSRPWTLVVASHDPDVIQRCERQIRLSPPSTAPSASPTQHH